MNENKGFKTIAVIAIIISVICISVAYAALQATLKIEGTATVKTTDAWKINFTAVKNNSATDGAQEITAPTAVAPVSKLTWSTRFGAPKASYTFTATITNSGTIPAKLDSADSYLGSTGTAVNSFDYTVTIDNKSIDEYSGYVWESGASKDIVVVTFDKDSLLSTDDLKNLNTQSVTFTLDLPFSQATDAEVAAATSANQIFKAN